ERYAKDDVDVFDHTFKKDQEIGLLLAAANRDPIAFNNPNRFEPERQNPGNVSLGAGVHFCVGAPLARMEMKIALRELFKHFPKLKLTRKPIYSDRYHFHGFNELWVAP
ncbi:MAG: cytochrome P450, partial [Rhodobacteraceae bacterium]|nr:cytochrome P450 [Paracoccaceae bacterium]